MKGECKHLSMVELPMPGDDDKDGAVCAECVKIGSDWVHLRQCLTCGGVGCCDDSPHRHARAHFKEAEHPIIASMEPGEDWAYCYLDDVYVEPESP